MQTLEGSGRASEEREVEGGRGREVEQREVGISRPISCIWRYGGREVRRCENHL